MAYAIAAAKLNSGGNEQALTSMLDRAKEQAEAGRAAARAQGARTEEEAADLAVARAARDDIIERDSILKD